MEEIILSIKNLYFSYEKEDIFKNINLDFSKNRIYGITGDSGAGKTTFLKILSLLIREYSGYKINGEIIFKNRDILSLKKDFWKIRRRIIYIPQKPVPFKMSVFKNIVFPLTLSEKHSNDELEKIAANVLKKVNLFNEVKDKFNSHAEELSGGQLQRLSIARALTLSPDILLFDEPTSSLDENNAKIIETLLLSLKKTVTILVVSHNISFLKNISDEIYKISNQKILESP